MYHANTMAHELSTMVYIKLPFYAIIVVFLEIHIHSLTKILLKYYGIVNLPWYHVNEIDVVITQYHGKLLYYRLIPCY